jgi:protein-disulfide isomerase
MSRRERFLDIAVGLMAVCAVVVASLAVRHEFFPNKPAPAAGPAAVADWERFTTAGQWIGNPRAPVRMVVFSDFQCPACRALFERTAALQARNPGRVAILYRHYPLPNHPFARDAAVASECAAEQGRFEPFHELLFRDQEAIGTRSWEEFARGAGVPDVPRFDGCLRGTEARRRVAADIAAGDELGIDGTPTTIVEGRKVTGAGSVLDSLIAGAIQRTR